MPIFSNNLNSTRNNISKPIYRFVRLHLLFIIVALVAIPFFLGMVCYFSVLGYDFPFRLNGHYEKGLYLAQRPFTISPDGKNIVYASTITGHGDLYQMDINGRNVRRLTTDPEYESDPCYTPDGHMLIFSRETAKCGHIWMMKADGSEAKQLTFGPDYDDGPVFTPDGQYVWFRRTPQGTIPGQYTMFTMKADGKNIVQQNVNAPELYREIAFAPRGGSVYYVRRDYSEALPKQIWRMGRDGNEKHEIAKGNNVSVSPMGDIIAFIAGFDICIMKPDGSNQKLVYHSNTTKRFVAIGGYGQRLFFLEETVKGVLISSIMLDGSHYNSLMRIL